MLIPDGDLPINLMSSFNLTSLNPLKKFPMALPTDEPAIDLNTVDCPILMPRLVNAPTVPPPLTMSCALAPPSPARKPDARPLSADMAVECIDDVTCPATTFLNTLVVALRSPADAMLAMLMLPVIPDMSIPPMFLTVPCPLAKSLADRLPVDSLFSALLAVLASA